jgi:hypothetical protein
MNITIREASLADMPKFFASVAGCIKTWAPGILMP